MTVRALVTVAFVALVGGCASVPAQHHAEILVTFPVSRFAETTYGGSQRANHGPAWSVPLHTRMAVRRFAEDHALVATDAWPIRPLGVYCVAFATTRTSDLDALIAMLANDGRVDVVEANHSFEGMITARPTYDDPLFELQYGEFRARVEALHAISTGQHVKLGLIDSSIDLEHPDLAGQIARQTELVPGGEMRQRIHGTAVAGVIGATPANGLGVVGLAPAAELQAYGACTSDGDKTRCSAFALAKALAHAIDDRLQVLNISLAGPENRLLAALIDRAIADGMIVIAATNPADPARNFPASAPGVVAASADDPLWFARPEQLSTQAGGGYQVFFGSSVAAAGMAGLAALVRAHSSAKSTRDLLEWLVNSRCAESAGAPMPVAFDLAQLCH